MALKDNNEGDDFADSSSQQNSVSCMEIDKKRQCFHHICKNRGLVIISIMLSLHISMKSGDHQLRISLRSLLNLEEMQSEF